mmetsp:Transcript_111790/g.194021  ORF Transcript_111790/g.194021 Transcript_111790/m.194021 type:complete len:206 (-) Transcript_111790:479-1096(-)
MRGPPAGRRPPYPSASPAGTAASAAGGRVAPRGRCWPGPQVLWAPPARPAPWGLSSAPPAVRPAPRQALPQRGGNRAGDPWEPGWGSFEGSWSTARRWLASSCHTPCTSAAAHQPTGAASRAPHCGGRLRCDRRSGRPPGPVWCAPAPAPGCSRPSRGAGCAAWTWPCPPGTSWPASGSASVRASPPHGSGLSGEGCLPCPRTRR